MLVTQAPMQSVCPHSEQPYLVQLVYATGTRAFITLAVWKGTSQASRRPGAKVKLPRRRLRMGRPLMSGQSRSTQCPCARRSHPRASGVPGNISAHSDSRARRCEHMAQCRQNAEPSAPRPASRPPHPYPMCVAASRCGAPRCHTPAPGARRAWNPNPSPARTAVSTWRGLMRLPEQVPTT